MKFMQDNAPIHSAKKIKMWFENNAIPVMNWPPYFSDLNLIEHIWAKLKEQIYKIEPGLECLIDADEEVRTVFTRAIEHAWENLGQDYFNRLIKSMDDRVNAVLDVNEWYTRF